MYRSHNTLSMHNSEVVSRQIPASAQQHLAYSTHGTRVTVRDLFGSMPVRVKQRAIVAEKQQGYRKEWEELKREVVGLLLSWPTAVSVTAREASSNQKLAIRSRNEYHVEDLVRIDIPSVCSILSQASFTSPEENASWVSVRASMPTLDINGTISLEPSPTKHLQFISFGIQPLVALDGQSILHDEINRLFSQSAFGNEEEAEDLNDSEKERRANDRRYKGDGHTNKELKGGKKGVDRWPMFYIHIQQTSRSKLAVDDILDDKGSSLTSILELLQAMIFEFLTRHHFRPKAGRRVKFDQNDKGHCGSPSLRNIVTASATKSSRTDSEQMRCLTGPSPGEKKLSDTVAFDPLLTNVKLPSFRRPATQIDAAFNSWSKIKFGASALQFTGLKSLLDDQPVRAPGILRPSTAPPYSKGDVAKGRSSISTLTRRPSTPLLSKSGKLVRRPFEEVISKSQPRAPTSHTGQQDRQETGPKSNDDMIYWMNPITKKESFVNQRTGLTVPVTRSNKNPISKRIIGSEARAFSSRPNLTRTTNSSSGEPSLWLSNILKTWDNPIFLPAEKSIPQVSLDGADATTQEILHGRHNHCSQIDIDKAFKDSSAGVSSRISKDALKNAEVVSQVDKKFILIKVTTTTAQVGEGGKMLILVDQHAADERIRIETLMDGLCSPPKSDDSIMPSEARIMTTPLDKPLVFEVPSAEIELLRTHEQHFANWGILYDFPSTTTVSEIRGVKSIQHLTVRCLPPGIIERCKIEPRLLIDLVRTEVHKVSSQSIQISPPTGDWLQRIHTCPRGIIDMLNSRACRSSIMFNDELSKEQCEILVGRLAECKFPFQCAHGRPSLVPLVDLGRLKMESISTLALEKRGSVEEGLGRSFQKWKASIAENPAL
jgi:DNA mismatch repair protein MLH3